MLVYVSLLQNALLRDCFRRAFGRDGLSPDSSPLEQIIIVELHSST
jgi:hypothetical protein